MARQGAKGRALIKSSPDVRERASGKRPRGGLSIARCEVGVASRDQSIGA